MSTKPSQIATNFFTQLLLQLSLPYHSQQACSECRWIFPYFRQLGYKKRKGLGALHHQCSWTVTLSEKTSQPITLMSLPLSSFKIHFLFLYEFIINRHFSGKNPGVLSNYNFWTPKPFKIHLNALFLNLEIRLVLSCREDRSCQFHF